MVAQIAQKYSGIVAETYERDRANGFAWLYEDVIFASTLRMLFELYGGVQTALDMPCGTGRFHRHYDDYGIDCVGVDLSSDMLALAYAKGMKTVKHDFFNLSAIGPADLVVCVRFLNFFCFDLQARAIEILAGQTKKWLFIQIETHQDCEQSGLSKSIYYPTILQVRKNLESNGLAVMDWHAAEIKKGFSTNIILAQSKNHKGE